MDYDIIGCIIVHHYHYLYHHLFWSADCPIFGYWLLCHAGSAVPLACSHDSWQTSFLSYAACYSRRILELFYSSPDTTFSKQPWVLLLNNKHTHIIKLGNMCRCVCFDFYQQQMGVVFVSHSWQHLVLSVFFILAILVSVCRANLFYCD